MEGITHFLFWSNNVKMSILPKLLYLFETLWVPIPKNNLKKFQLVLLKCIWAGGWRRLRGSILYSLKSLGGLGVLDVGKNYHAVYLCALASWVPSRSLNCWTGIEKLWVVPTYPNAWLWSSTVIPQRASLLAPMYFSYTIWRQESKIYVLSAPKSLLMSFQYTPIVPDSLTTCMVESCREKDLMRFDQIVHPLTRSLRHFSDLREWFSFQSTAFYSYIQIRHLALSIMGDLTFSTDCQTLKNCNRGTTERGMVSQAYRILISLPLDPFPKHVYMLKWKEVLGREFPPLLWQTLWTQAQRSSICTLYKENAYKILMRWYHTPDVLYAVYPSVR